MPSYAFIAKDYTTQAALYTHHQYIAIALMCGAFAHGAIFFIRDYDPEANKDNVLARMLEHKEAIISHLSRVSLFLGFHTLGLYVHNDVVVSFGTPEKQILVEPVFAQVVQAASGKAMYGMDVLLSNASSSASLAAQNIPGDHYWLDAINGNTDVFLPIGPGDFLVHHAIALGLHTTTLILVKGALDARGDLVRQRGSVQRIQHLPDGLVPRLPLAQLLSADQRVQPVRQQQPGRLVLDVPVRSPGVGHRFHVPDLLAWLLAGADRDHRLGSPAQPHRQHDGLARQACGSLDRSGSCGRPGSLLSGLCPHLRGVPDRVHIRQVRLIHISPTV